MLPKCPRESVLTSPRINRRREGGGGLRNARHFHLKSHFNGTFQTQNVNSIRISEGGERSIIGKFAFVAFCRRSDAELGGAIMSHADGILILKGSAGREG